MCYYYVAPGDQEQMVKVIGVICNAEGYIPLITSFRIVDTYCIDDLEIEQYSLFKIDIGAFKGQVKPWVEDDYHTEYRIKLLQNSISPEYITYLGKYEVSRRNYLLERLNYEYLIAIRADSISILGEDGRVERVTPDELIDHYIDYYFIPQGVLHIDKKDILNYVHNNKHTYYYYVANPEEVNEIRQIGIFPSDNRGVIELTASMQDTNHIAYDRLKTNKYGLFRILPDGIKGELIYPGEEDIHKMQRRLLIQKHIMPDKIEYFGSHEINLKSYYLEKLKLDYTIVKLRGEYAIENCDGYSVKVNLDELIPFYISNFFEPNNIHVYEEEALWYALGYSKTGYRS